MNHPMGLLVDLIILISVLHMAINLTAEILEYNFAGSDLTDRHVVFRSID